MHKTRWARLPFGVRMTVGAVALMVPLVGGIFAIAAALGGTGADQAADRHSLIATSDPAASTPEVGGTPAPPGGGTDMIAGLGGAPGVPHADPGGANGVGVVPGSTDPAPAPQAPGRPTYDTEMPMGGTPVDPATDYEPVHVPPAPPPPAPVVETRTVTETEAIPFQTQFVRDSSLPRRSHEVRVPGEPGVKTLTYEVTTTDGQQTAKRLVSEAVTKDPVTRVIAIGTGRGTCDNHGESEGGNGDGGDGDGAGDWESHHNDEGDQRCETPTGGS